MTRGVDPDSIPRYEIPEQVYTGRDDEPERGNCWNCDHMVTVRLDGREYDLCVVQRDTCGVGDVWETDAKVTDCQFWVEC